MSSKQHLDALAAERAHSATLRKMILLVAAVGALGMYFAHAMPKRLDLHVAPDIKAGDWVRVQMRCYGFDQPQNKGVAFSFSGIQLVEEGEALASGGFDANLFEDDEELAGAFN